MRKSEKIIILIAVAVIFTGLFATPAFAITESEVQAQVDSAGKEAVAGNVFIWFLCAIAFLKVSQKIDSFMSSLGINVGHTGGSMMAEAIIAARGISAVKGFAGGGGFKGGGGGGSGRSSGGSSAGAAAAAGFMSGGLVGAVGRQFTNGAVKNATGAGGGGLGGRLFASSMSKGGNFANNVIGSVAKGSVQTVGTMTGESAEAALLSYMGYAGMEGEDVPRYSGVEIGGGRIMGSETTPENPNGIAFGMYSAEQYTAPKGDYTTVTAVDGSQWYKQYATDAVEKTPYMAPDGQIAYNESLVKKLPDPPRRKDKI